MRDVTAEAGAAWTTLEVRFNPNHGTGGQFASAPGQAEGKSTPSKDAAQKKQLLERAAADRKRISNLRQQLEEIEKQLHSHPHQAAKVTKKSVNAAKSAAAKKAAATKAAHGGGKSNAPAGKSGQHGGGQSLQQKADAIKHEISTLQDQVKTLDAKAARL